MRIAALMKRIKILEADAVLFGQKIANVEELLRASRESNYRRLRHLKRAVNIRKDKRNKESGRMC